VKMTFEYLALAVQYVKSVLCGYFVSAVVFAIDVVHFFVAKKKVVRMLVLKHRPSDQR